MESFRIGDLFVHRESRLLVEVVAVSDDEVVLEYDDDGGEVHYTFEDMRAHFEPWQEGAIVDDRTGKGRFVNPGHPDYRPKRS